MIFLALIMTILTLHWMCKNPTLIRLLGGLGMTFMDLIVVGQTLD